MFLDRTISGYDLELHVGAPFFLTILRAELRLALGADGTHDLRGALPGVPDGLRYLHLHALDATLVPGPPLELRARLRLTLGPHPVMVAGQPSTLSSAPAIAGPSSPTPAAPAATSTPAAAALRDPVAEAVAGSTLGRPVGSAPQGPDPIPLPAAPGPATPAPPPLFATELNLVLRLRLSDLGVALRLGGARDLLTAVVRWAGPQLGAHAGALAAALTDTLDRALARAGVVPVPGLAGLHHLAWRALPAGPDTAAALVLLGNLPLALGAYTDSATRRAPSPYVRLQIVDTEHLTIHQALPYSASPGAPPQVGPWQTRDPRALSPELRREALGAVLDRTNWTLQAVDATRLRLLYADGGVVPAAEVLALRARALAQPHPRGDAGALRASLPPGVPLRLAVSPLMRGRLQAALVPRLAAALRELSGAAALSLWELDIDWHTNPVPGRITLRVRVKVEKDLVLFGADGIATYVQDVDLRVAAGRLQPVVGQARIDADGWLELWGGVMDFFTAGLRAFGHAIPTAADLLENAEQEAHRAALVGVTTGLDQVPAGVEYARRDTPMGPDVLWLDVPITDLRLGPAGAALHFAVHINPARPTLPAAPR
ncbi:MAG: hypothetical protein RL071_1935 [Pseudomonadota bacterium]|jgi:hypothetical protein